MRALSHCWCCPAAAAAAPLYRCPAAGAALCTTWLVFELAPARRAKADCCGNCSCCIAPINAGTYLCDICYATLFYMRLTNGEDWVAEFSVAVMYALIMMVLFTAIMVLSAEMGRATREMKQQQVASAVGTALVPEKFAVAAAAGPTATPKVVAATTTTTKVYSKGGVRIDVSPGRRDLLVISCH